MPNDFGEDFFDNVLGAAEAPINEFFQSTLRPPDQPPPIQMAPLDIGPGPSFQAPDFSNYQPQFFSPPSFDAPNIPFSMDFGNPFSMPEGNFDTSWGKGFFEDLQTKINANTQQAKAEAAAKEGGKPGTPGSVSGATDPPTKSGEIEAYIRQAAAARGINPNVAVQVALAEGGVDEPARAGDPQAGGSYGPFQLNYLPGSIGSQFTTATGLHASDPRAWKAGVDFALNEVAARGWGAFKGAARVGITGFTGIGVNPVAPGPSAAPTGTGSAAPSSIGSTPIGPTGAYNVGFGYGQAYGTPITGDSGQPLTHHQGVDLIVPGAPSNGRGSPILAFENGRVTSISRAAVAGIYLTVTDAEGRDHVYMHMDGATPKIGDQVIRGQTPIGILGGTGTEEWPHLHYEVRVNGQHVDPSPWLGQ